MRGAEADRMILEGATPAQIDRVLYDFGFPMGPFAMMDLAGLDIGGTRQRRRAQRCEKCCVRTVGAGRRTVVATTPTTRILGRQPPTQKLSNSSKTLRSPKVWSSAR